MLLLRAVMLLAVCWGVDGAIIFDATTTLNRSASRLETSIHLSGTLRNGTWWRVYDFQRFISETHPYDWEFSLESADYTNARWTYIGPDLTSQTTQYFSITGEARENGAVINPPNSGGLETGVVTPEPSQFGTCLLTLTVMFGVGLCHGLRPIRRDGNDRFCSSSY
jgi:hypothetical protein